MVSPKSEQPPRKRKREEKHGQLLKQIERGQMQAEQEEQLKRELERELEGKKDESWSKVYDNIDLLIAKRAESSATSEPSTDEEDNDGGGDDGDLVPEWMDDSSECSFLSDLVLWRHVDGVSQAAAWLQVPFDEVQIDQH